MFDIVQEPDGTLRGSGEIIGGKVANASPMGQSCSDGLKDFVD
jgi:hypothetical protein